MPNKQIKNGVCETLAGLMTKLDIDHDDPNFLETPDRIFRAYSEMLLTPEVINQELDHIFSKIFPTSYQGHVIWPDIVTFSMCPHHMLPVEYMVTIAYLPAKEKVIGLSKPVRFARLLACRPLLQETYTQDMADILSERTDARGVAIITRGVHGCMKCRGVKTNKPVIMAVMNGAYMDDEMLRQEFFELLKLYKE